MFAEPGWDMPLYYAEKEKNNKNDSDKIKNHYTEIGTLEKENFEILEKINSLQNKFNENSIRIEEIKKEIESIKNPKKKILKP